MFNSPFVQIVLNNLSNTTVPIVDSGESFTVEIRAKFPSATDSVMAPTELSGAIVTLQAGALDSGYISLWYEKNSSTDSTGNVYLTSSAGRLQLTSASIFNGDFYNFAIVKNITTGSVQLYATKCENGIIKYQTSSIAYSGNEGYPVATSYVALELGSSVLLPSRAQFWAHELRLWNDYLTAKEISSHAMHFENYGRDQSYKNNTLKIHWRMNEGVYPNSSGKIYVGDSTLNNLIGTGSNFTTGSNAFTKFLCDYAYIPSIDYGWNQKKIRAYSGSYVKQQDRYDDEKYVSVEFNLYDQLNEDISHLMTSYQELNDILGNPVNKYRESYEGLQQMRETYFKRLQGDISFTSFVDMLDFFDTEFISSIEKLLPARSAFKGDELIVESHLLERPKYQYQLKPVKESSIIISGSISISDIYQDDLWR